MSRRWQQWIGFCYLVILSIPLLIHAYTGTFVRFIADDYCSSAIARAGGLLGGTIQWYLTWSGRFSANFLDSLVGTIGPGITSYTTPLVLTLWFLALAAAVWHALPAGGNSNKFLITGVSTLLLLFCTLEMSPNTAQSLYWEQGMHSVVPPLIFASAYFGLLLYKLKSSPSSRTSAMLVFLSPVMTFVAGGFSETYVTLQTTLLIILFVFGLLLNPEQFRKKLLWFSAAGLLGSVLALILVIAAPGNQFRQATFPPPPGFLDLIRITVENSLRFLIDIVISKRHLLTAAVLFAVFAMLGSGFLADAGVPFPTVLRRQWTLPHLLLAAAAIQLSCFAPAAYGTSEAPPDRTLIIPAFALVCTLALFGYFTGKYAAEKIRIRTPKFPLALSVGSAAVIGCMMILTVSWNSYKTIKLEAVLRTYSENWDQVDQTLRDAKSQGLDSVSIDPLQNGIGLTDIGPDSTMWVNQCFRDYYGITVTTK
ncbi:MAG: DUF6056 family protein [Anaerolineales bacterium]|jgi:hypothetical protein